MPSQRQSIVHKLLDSQIELQSSQGRQKCEQSSQSPVYVKQQINDLEKKLLHLENCMKNLDVTANEEEMNKVSYLLSESSLHLNKHKLQMSVSEGNQEKQTRKNSKILLKRTFFQNKENQKKLNADNTKRNKNKIPQLNICQYNGFSKKSHRSNQSNHSNREKSKTSQYPQASQKSKTSTHIQSLASNKSSSLSLNSKRSKNTSFRQNHNQTTIQNNNTIHQLKKQLNYYKVLCSKQKAKLQEYRIMQKEMKKIEINFAKSQKIRKQQKKIIQQFNKNEKISIRN